MVLSVPPLSEDQLLCPICLGVFVEPVSTPCGHNFCMSCLSSYWDGRAPVCLCPVCKESFSHRPQLRVNTFISGLSQSFSSLQLRQEPQTSVLCDVCTAPQQDALMSCVECLSSFCSDHLEPHHRVPGLRRHTLIPPDSSLQDRVCPQHQQLLHSYCTEEGALLCASCEGAHSKHKTLPLEQACRELRDQLEPEEAKITSLIQEKVQRVCSIRETKAQRHEETRRVIAQSEEVLQDVLKKVQKSHKDLVQKMEEKQQQADSEAEALVEETEQEIANLTEAQIKLQELKQTEDPLIFLQKHLNMSLVGLNSPSNLRRGKDKELAEMRETLKSCTPQFQMLLKKLEREMSLFYDEKWCALRRVQRHAVDLKLDPETANPHLLLSADLKQVTYTSHVTLIPINKSKSFSYMYVIADRCFSSGRFYFEVSVGQKEEWILGLIAESVPRNKRPVNGIWALYFRINKYYTYNNRNVPVYWGKVERVGVFVDYDKGLVSFYDVKTATCIYSFTRCAFTEKIYPLLGPCDHEFPSNWVPMIIVPVGNE